MPLRGGLVSEEAAAASGENAPPTPAPNPPGAAAAEAAAAPWDEIANPAPIPVVLRLGSPRALAAGGFFAAGGAAVAAGTMGLDGVTLRGYAGAGG